mmetsp:Transcript_23331/g.54051  ORF Transcript_23331/g.54051 Transcript_23331/m.54051 type:complete len:227 (-) Transcript_23331:2109-2789(-)
MRPSKVRPCSDSNAFAELSSASNCTRRKTCVDGAEPGGGRMTSRRRTVPYLSISSFVSSVTSCTSCWLCTSAAVHMFDSSSRHVAGATGCCGCCICICGCICCICGAGCCCAAPPNASQPPPCACCGCCGAGAELKSPKPPPPNPLPSAGAPPNPLPSPSPPSRSGAAIGAGAGSGADHCVCEGARSLRLSRPPGRLILILPSPAPGLKLVTGGGARGSSLRDSSR